jgi:hypothetical protein
VSPAGEALWVIGGEQRSTLRQQNEWNSFGAAVVARVDPASGKAERVLEYTSPPERCPDDRPSFVFKAATIAGDTAWLCTQTEVLECALPSFAIRRVISLPCFNDLHHVTPGPDGTLFVAVTGLDAVAEVTRDGELLRLVSVLGGSPWDRFSPEVDYRKVATTKPHLSHPNYVFVLDGEPWVTRFEQRDAVPLDGLGTDGARRFAVGGAGIHDGCMDDIDGGRLFFTTVDGQLVRFGLADGERRDLDLNTLLGAGRRERGEERGDRGDRPLGWCRGVLPVGGRAWVGFTRLRPTLINRNLSWIRHGFRDVRLPTRIALYDLEQPARLREVNVETAGVNAVFSIHPCTAAES